MTADSLSDLPFSDMLNLLPDGVVCHQAIRDETKTIVDFRLIYYNKAFESFAPDPYKRGLDMRMLGDNSSEVHILGPIMQRYVQVVETGEMGTHIYYDSNLKATISLRARKLGDGVLVTLRDITAQQIAAEQAERQNKLLQGILNTSLNGTIVYEAIRDDQDTIIDFRFRLYNQTVRKELLLRIGKDVDEHTLMSLYAETNRPGLFELYVLVTQTGESIRTESFSSVLNAWYDLSITKLGDGCLVTFVDITDLKQATRQAREQASFVNKLLDGSLNGLVSVDPMRESGSTKEQKLIDLKIASVNRSAAVFFQREQNELIGRGMLELYPEVVEMGLWHMFEQVLINSQSERMEACWQTDTTELWLDVSATPRDGDGLVLSFINITERKKAEQHTDALIQQLQKTNNNLEQFAYVASHDLQEPLRKVIAFGDILYNQYAETLGTGGSDIINRMQSAASRMQVLIKDLLAYSRVANSRELFGKVDLNQVVKEVTNDLELAIQDKKANLSIESLPLVYGDASQLRQLFQNLISNALKFSRADLVPRVQIRADLVRGREVLRPDGGNLLPESLANRGFHRIWVIDNGIGFDQRYADRIFQLFQRLHNRSQYTGTGIGLSIVQKVVENHLGFISAQGWPDEGASFVILLPIKTL